MPGIFFYVDKDLAAQFAVFYQRGFIRRTDLCAGCIAVWLVTMVTTRSYELILQNI